jgi:hypothetical protein
MSQLPKPQAPPLAADYATLDDVALIESIGTELDGRSIYVWFRLTDGRAARFQFEPGLPPGLQDLRLKIIKGA